MNNAGDFETKEEAKTRLGELEAQLMTPGLQKHTRNSVILEKLMIQKILGTGRLPSQAQAAGKAVREAKRQALRSEGRPKAPAETPPLFVDDYKGPRCDYCAGPKPSGICLNAGPDWPHPPENGSRVSR